MADIAEKWTEEDSKIYQALAAVAVPAREEQIAALLMLLPFGQAETFRVIELGCGPGTLAFALLDRFPGATVVGLDGSPLMRERAAGRLNRFGPRASLFPFDLAAPDTWLDHLQEADCVLSSLCLHHLPGPAKQELFTAVVGRLSARGAFLIADLVAAQRPEAAALFADSWDRLAQAQSRAASGADHLFEKFLEAEWNYYRFPDPADQPSSLFDQLAWLKAAGLAVVDCFWLQAGHAIYGGTMAGQPAVSNPALSFTAALQSARAAVQATT